jgi:hypothetical protein
MTTKTYDLYGGKYTIVYEEGPQIIEILRNNTTWKTIDNVVGDNVLKLLFERVLDLEAENKDLEEERLELLKKINDHY